MFPSDDMILVGESGNCWMSGVKRNASRDTRNTDVPTEVAGKDEAAGPRIRIHKLRSRRTLTHTHVRGKVVSRNSMQRYQRKIMIDRENVYVVSLTFDHPFRRGELLRVVRGHAVSG